MEPGAEIDSDYLSWFRKPPVPLPNDDDSQDTQTGSIDLPPGRRHRYGLVALSTTINSVSGGYLPYADILPRSGGSSGHQLPICPIVFAIVVTAEGVSPARLLMRVTPDGGQRTLTVEMLPVAAKEALKSEAEGKTAVEVSGGKDVVVTVIQKGEPFTLGMRARLTTSTHLIDRTHVFEYRSRRLSGGEAVSSYKMACISEDRRVFVYGEAMEIVKTWKLSWHPLAFDMALTFLVVREDRTDVIREDVLHVSNGLSVLTVGSELISLDGQLMATLTPATSRMTLL
jgi:hypothetical protein